MNESSVFLVNGQNMGMTLSYILLKIRKKGHPIDFLGPYYSVVLKQLTFFDQIWS